METRSGPLPRAVVLLSGGLDSATVLAIARTEGFDPVALTFQYGQRHGDEVEAARRVAGALGVTRHHIMTLPLDQIGGSALTADIPVPKGRSDQEIGQGIPITYVPARNTIFLAFGLAWCEVMEARDLFIGVNALDFSGYPDCRPEYLEAFERVARLATRAAVEDRERPFRVHAPLLHLSKAEIIRQGTTLGLDYGLTRSCYDPGLGGEACGLCDACQLRLKGFREAGLTDPAVYQRTPTLR